MVKNFFREVGIRLATKQTQLVDAITEEAPIIEMMPMAPATHGYSNVFEKLSAVTAAQIVDLDDELPEVDASSELSQTDLSVIGGRMYVGVDKAKKFGTAENYFEQKLPPVLRVTGSNVEQTLIYDNMRQTAIDNGNVIDIGGSSNTNFSIVVVKWVQGETTGLYDAAGFGDGKMLEVIPHSGGNPYIKTISSKDLLVYGADFKTYFGIQLANDRYISAMVNIDIDSVTQKVPTEAQINELIYKARGNPANTLIYCHPRLLSWMYGFKASHLEVQVNIQDMNQTFRTWNGIPIVSSYNFYDGTEANV